MKEEIRKYAKPQYKCAICGEIYDDVQNRMNCEMKCLKKQQEEEKRAAEAKAKAERNARQQEVTAALDNAFALVNKFVEEYGTYRYNGKITDLDMAKMDLFPNKLWNYFFF